MTDQRAAWDSLGLPEVLKGVLTLNGAPPNMGSELHAFANSLPTSAFVQQNILDSLAPASPQMGPNLVEAANSEAAAALLAWSDALKFNPTVAPIAANHYRRSPKSGRGRRRDHCEHFGHQFAYTTEVSFGTKSASGGSCCICSARFSLHQEQEQSMLRRPGREGHDP